MISVNLGEKDWSEQVTLVFYMKGGIQLQFPLCGTPHLQFMGHQSQKHRTFDNLAHRKI